MAVNSKNKGNTWEREVAKFLSSIFKESFIRSMSSGAFVGGLNAHRKDTLSESQITMSKGDIIPPDNMLKLNIEAKFYGDMSFHQLIDNDCPQLNSWIDQSNFTADTGDISFIIFKINRRGSWVVFHESLIKKFKLDGYVRYKHEDQFYIIVDFEKFFTTNYKKIKLLAKTEKGA